jgi:UDPglucose 6-dehydrogenase
MDVGIVGYGYVGKAVAKYFGDRVKAIFDPAFDLMEEVPATSTGDMKNFMYMDLIVVCVPTNETADGSADISAVSETLKAIQDLMDFKGVVLIKSAIPPTVAKRVHDFYDLRIVVSPEYIGEGGYEVPERYPHPTDMKKHKFQIFGGDPKDTSACVDMFKQVSGPDCSFFQVNVVTAALCKYMENNWLALKVSFCNTFYDICEGYSKFTGQIVDYNVLRELFVADGRVEMSHTHVFPDNRGYGGKCLPKDTKALREDLKEIYSSRILNAMIEYNEHLRLS